MSRTKARVRKSARFRLDTWRWISTIAGLIGELPEEFLEKAAIERANYVHAHLMRQEKERDRNDKEMESPGTLPEGGSSALPSEA